jgi:hypothetical protein
MTLSQSNSGVPVYDPRGIVEVEAKPLAPRVGGLDGLRLAVLDNTKWNAGRLLRSTTRLLAEAHDLAATNYYRKESFSKVAAPELVAEIRANNDLALTAIGD